MVEPVVQLGWMEVLLLFLMTAVSVGISLALHLGFARDLTVATVRSTVQLLAVGLVIGWVFEQANWYWVTGLLLVMTTIAGVTGARQSKTTVRGISVLLTFILGALTAVTLFYLSVVVIGVREWNPRYLIPLGGMLLGNGMTAATLAVERMVSELERNADRVEVMLALGASPGQASHDARRAALTAALTPTINTMLIVGIITLPGMMTGQMLGGTAPLQAATYQLLILVGIAFIATLTATIITGLVSRRFFTPAWQFDRIALERAAGRRPALKG
jgi:putative ABC transport system permease protein